MYYNINSARTLCFYFDCVQQAIGWRVHVVTLYIRGRTTVQNHNINNFTKSQTNTEWSESRCIDTTKDDLTNCRGRLLNHLFSGQDCFPAQKCFCQEICLVSGQKHFDHLREAEQERLRQQSQDKKGKQKKAAAAGQPGSANTPGKPPTTGQVTAGAAPSKPTAAATGKSPRLEEGAAGRTESRDTAAEQAEEENKKKEEEKDPATKVKIN